MAGGKETPRQKMIGMMYLVLTALLALNISKEVLNGFVKVENSLRKTQVTLATKNANAIGAMENSSNPEKTAPFLAEAKKIQRNAEDLVSYIQELKARSMSFSGGDYEEQEPLGFSKYLGKDAAGKDTTLNLVHIDKKDEYQALTTFLVGSEPASPKEDEWSAHQLRTRLEAFRESLKQITFKDVEGQTRTLPQSLKNQVDKTFVFENEMENGVEVLWEAANFYDVPLAAVMPLMTKLVLDVQNTEADIISWLAGDVDSKSFKFTSLVPLVVPQSSYLLRGDSFRAEVLLAAFDNTNRPTIYVDNNKWNGRDSSTIETDGLDPLSVSSNGFGALRIATNNLPLGEAAYKGVIQLTGPDGSVEDYPFFTPPFQVAEPALVVSPTQMNVFYRGVPNPVEVSVPGVSSDKINVSISGGHKITQQPDGTYIVEPGAAKDADISVTAELPDGSKKSMPAKKFRVKRIPDPVPTFGGKSPSDRSIDRTTLRGVPGVSARMENFDFNVSVVVKSFQLVVSKDGTLIRKASNSNRLTQDMKSLLESCARGTVIYLEDIVVKMPDNTERQLAPLKLTVN